MYLPGAGKGWARHGDHPGRPAGVVMVDTAGGVQTIHTLAKPNKLLNVRETEASYR